MVSTSFSLRLEGRSGSPGGCFAPGDELRLHVAPPHSHRSWSKQWLPRQLTRIVLPLPQCWQSDSMPFFVQESCLPFSSRTLSLLTPAGSSLWRALNLGSVMGLKRRWPYETALHWPCWKPCFPCRSMDQVTSFGPFRPNVSERPSRSTFASSASPDFVSNPIVCEEEELRSYCNRAHPWMWYYWEGDGIRYLWPDSI